MTAAKDDSFEMRLKNAEGVPILLLGGTITANALKAVKFTLEKLASAGHYHVVVNIEKAQAANWRFLTGLSDAVRKFREHYGAIDLVATREAVQNLLHTDQIPQLFRLSDSEGKAISMIKGLARQPGSIGNTTARLK